MWRLVVLAAVLIGCETHAERTSPPQGTAPVARSADRLPAQAFAEAYRLIRREDFKAARPLLERLEHPALDDYVMHYRALALARTNETQRALDLWTRLVVEYPQSVHYHAAQLERGRTLAAMGKTDAARSAFEAARGSPSASDRQTAALEIAELDLAAGLVAEAYEQLMAVRDAVPGTPTGQRAKDRIAALRRANASLRPAGAEREDEVRLLLREGDHAPALPYIVELLEEAGPQEVPELLRLRAEAELGAGQLDRALATLREIYLRFPLSGDAPAAAFRRARLMWNKDRNAEAKAAFTEFLARYPQDRNAAEARYALARLEQAAGRHEQAIADYVKLMRAHPRTKLAREAKWRIGWIRYERGQWRAAAEEFGRLARESKKKQAVDALYWQARALENAGSTDAARAIYRRVLDEWPASYYAYWAEQRLEGSVPRPARIAGPAPGVLGPPPSTASDLFHGERARELQRIGLSAAALRELRAFEDANERSAELTRYLIDAYPTVHGYRDAKRLRKRARVKRPESAYPLAFWPLVRESCEPYRIDPLMVTALMRQESMFDPEARSSADARGLLQLLPGTAIATGQRIGRAVNPLDLYDPETNIELGVAHLHHLLERYRGDWLRVLAAYNGGEDAVAKWDQRSGGAAPDEWVENISYRETRDYVKKVLANYRRYAQLYGG